MLTQGQPSLDPARPSGSPASRARWLQWLLFRLGDALGLPALIVLRWVIKALPRPRVLAAARALGTRLARIAPFSTFRRNLRAVLGVTGGSVDPALLQSLVEESAVHHLQHVVDFVKVLDQGEIGVDELFEVEGEEHLTRALGHGRGAILLSSHTGSWELAGAWIESRGHPLSVVYFEQPSWVLDRYLRRARQRAGMRLLPQRRGMRAAIEALRRNEIVAMVIDQDGTATGLFLELFGLVVSTPRVPIRLAVRYRCPVVHTYNLRRADGTYAQVFEPPLAPPPPDAPEAESLLMRQVLAQVEAVIRAHPAQWLLSYDRFKLRHEARLVELGLLDRARREQRLLDGLEG